MSKIHPSIIFIVLGLIIIMVTANPTTVIAGSINAAAAAMFLFGIFWGLLAFAKSRRKKPADKVV